MSTIIFFSVITLVIFSITWAWELLEEHSANAKKPAKIERTWLTRTYDENEALHLHYHLRIYHSIHPLQRRHMHDLGLKYEITKHMNEAGVDIHIPSGDWAAMIALWLTIADFNDMARQTRFTSALISNRFNPNV
jgi:hypothetical protein